jgi:molybdopterin synthase sulfur carrier subunit
LLRRRPKLPAPSFQDPDSMRDVATATIIVVYLARLREAFGAGSERFEPGPGLATVSALRERLAARGGVWANELAPGRAVRFAVNHELAGPDTPVRSGDEVALFPPVTGG